MMPRRLAVVVTSFDLNSLSSVQCCKTPEIAESCQNTISFFSRFFESFK